MKKGLILMALVVFWGMCVAIPAYSYSITFSGLDVSAELDYLYDDVNNVLAISLNNTSPTMDGLNAPAITGFGFDAANYSSITWMQYATYPVGYSGTEDESWAWANDEDKTATSIDTYWSLTSPDDLQGTGGIKEFDFIASTSQGSTVQGGLINPDVLDPLTGSNLFYTPAYFYIGLSGDPGELDKWYMRFQNVGIDGEDSITIPAGVSDPVDPNTAVPEPATILLVGSCLIALAGLRKKIKPL